MEGERWRQREIRMLKKHQISPSPQASDQLNTDYQNKKSHYNLYYVYISGTDIGIPCSTCTTECDVGVSLHSRTHPLFM